MLDKTLKSVESSYLRDIFCRKEAEVFLEKRFAFPHGI
jgi:hypothetical protein